MTDLELVEHVEQQHGVYLDEDALGMVGFIHDDLHCSPVEHPVDHRH